VSGRGTSQPSQPRQTLKGRNSLVSGNSVASTNLQFTDTSDSLYKVFFREIPRDSSRRKKCPLMISGKIGRSVVPCIEGQQISVKQPVIDPTIIRSQFGFGQG